jgi:hypothetical protein
VNDDASMRISTCRLIRSFGILADAFALHADLHAGAIDAVAGRAESPLQFSPAATKSM